MQDCNRGGEERSLASLCGECMHSHATRGKGEGAEHVQRREFLQDQLSVFMFILLFRVKKHVSLYGHNHYSLSLAVYTAQGVPEQPCWTGL